MSSNATTTAEASDKAPKTSELVLSDDGAEVRVVLDQSNPEFEAWLERQSAETVVFLPAHEPRKKPRDRWSSRKLERLRRRVGDAVAVAGEQRFEGPQPPVPGLFLPGMARARARAVALKVSVSQFFWARAGEPFEAHRTKALGLDDVFDESVWQIAREGMRDLMAAIRRFADDWRIVRQLVLGSYWWLAVFVLGMVGIGYALSSFVASLPGWCTAVPPAVAVGLRLRQLSSKDKQPDREFSMAESDAAWEEAATSRAFAWCIAAGGVVILEVCQALWRTGDGVLVAVGDSVTHIVVCIWLLQAVSFSRTADDVWSRAIGSVIGALVAIFGMKLMLGLMSFVMNAFWAMTVSIVGVQIPDSSKEFVNGVMALVGQLAFFIPMLGFTWARERTLFGFWLSNEMQEDF